MGDSSLSDQSATPFMRKVSTSSSALEACGMAIGEVPDCGRQRGGAHAGVGGKAVRRKGFLVFATGDACHLPRSARAR
jgi:hypothetical protein